MKLRFLTSISGPAGSYRPGETGEWSDNIDAMRLVDAGFAVPVIEDVETATAPALKVETASDTKARKPKQR